MTGSPSPLASDAVTQPNKWGRQSSSSSEEGHSPVNAGDAFATHQDNHSHSSRTSTQTLPQLSPRSPPYHHPTAASPGYETPYYNNSRHESPDILLLDPLAILPILIPGQEQSVSRSEACVAKTPKSQSQEIEVNPEEEQELESELPSDGLQDSDLPIIVGTPLQVRWMLKQKELYIDYKAVVAIGAPLLTKATSILDNKRQSDWLHDQRVRLAGLIKKFGAENELTFVVNFIGWILSNTRKTPPTDLNGAELEKERKWIDTEWEKDHLHSRWDVDYIADCIPPIRSGDPSMDKLIDQVPRIEKPRPDIAWGLWEDAFTKQEQKILGNQKNHLAGLGMYDVFFVLESKSINASLEEAENQCMRSGCAMVNTRRVLNSAAALQQPSKQQAALQQLSEQQTALLSSGPGPAAAAVVPPPSASSADMDSFAFSMALGAQDARIFVNWALVTAKGGVEWQMHQLRHYNFRSLIDVNRLHHDMDNILDWGVGSRKRKVVELCKNIEKKQLVMSAPPAKKVKMTTEETG